MSLRAPLLSLAVAAASGFVLSARQATAADQKNYEVTTSPAKAAVGAKGKTAVVLTAKNGWHLNEEFPVSLKLVPGAGVAVDKPKLVRKDLAESTKDRARFDVAFTASEAGQRTIEAEASFAVCQADACHPVKQKVVVAVEVAAPKK
jgi:hypothetical protein